jgi:hypothetical protein
MEMKKKGTIRIKRNVEAIVKRTYICRRSGMKAVFWDVVHFRK